MNRSSSRCAQFRSRRHWRGVLAAALATLPAPAVLAAPPGFDDPPGLFGDLVPLTGVQMIEAGGSHTCALTAGSAAKCWGLNSSGQLGDGNGGPEGNSHSAIPVDVVGLGGGMRAISAGGTHSCAVTQAGAAKCWGGNGHGQLGDNTLVSGLVPVDVVGLGSGVRAIGTGGLFSCALTTAGAVKCWGRNNYGQLGDGAVSNRPWPSDVVGLGSGVQAISVGGSHACALTQTGAAKCWGDNEYGQLGDGTSYNIRRTPVDVVGLDSGVIAISAGGHRHSCAVTAAGAAKCWGEGFLGSNTTEQQTTPVDVVDLGSGVLTIHTGFDHTCALTNAGAVKCWGFNASGQVGDGTNILRHRPVDVVDLGSGVQAISTGTDHACALGSAGATKCWGRNFRGQLGDNTTINRSTPVAVLTPPPPDPIFYSSFDMPTTPLPDPIFYDSFDRP